jgi:hypothetical protein
MSRQARDEELEIYLNQLIMAIKHQNFFRSALVDFLLGNFQLSITTLPIVLPPTSA